MYSAAVSSSRLPVTTMTGVSGAARSAMRSASAAPNVGSEWSVRMMSGAKVCSASRYARSESTRRAAPVMPARRSSRSISAASSATSSTIRTRTRSGIGSARLLVQEQPVEPDLGAGAREGLEVHRLDDVAVGAEAVRGRDVGLFLGRGEHHHRQRTRTLVAFEPAQHFQPVHFRELQIEQNHARRDADVAQRMALLAKEEFQGLGPVASHEHLIREIPGLEGAQGELHVARVVLDQQDLDFQRLHPSRLICSHRRRGHVTARRETATRYDIAWAQSSLWHTRNNLMRLDCETPEAGLEPATRRLTAGCSTS